MSPCPLCGGESLFGVCFEAKRSGQSLVDRIKAALDTVPMTVDELERALKVGHQSVSARVHDLSKRGVLEKVGMRPGRSGKACTIWRVRSLAQQSAATVEGFAS